MARIRSIKPEFFTSEQIVECSTSARLLFVGLWCHCDDAGRHAASVKRLKMEVYPGDSCSLRDVSGWVEELIANGLLIEYESQSQRYWQVTGWDKHQKIDRPTVKHPGPLDEGSTSIRRGLDECSPPESSRRLDDRSGAEPKTNKRPAGLRACFDSFWKAYPRKCGKDAAAKAYAAAVKRLRAELRFAEADPEEFLVERAAAFGVSPAGQAGKYTPHPATWLNAGRFDDDPKTWEQTSQGGRNGQPAPTDDDALYKWDN